MDLKRPRRLKPGDRVALVSLSWGGLGDPKYIHKYEIAKERLAREFGLDLVPMPHALKGTQFVAEHPELRARDLADAFRDDAIAAVFCAIGGDDSIRMLPYVDFDAIRQNPKIFMGYSDTTVGHFMMRRAGLVSFYGPSVMAEFGEYVAMPDYQREAVRRALFGDTAGWRIPPSPLWSDDHVPWAEENRNTARKYRPDGRGYEVLQGTGRARGRLLGGCLDVFPMCVGTEIWPGLGDWRGAILFFETSEDKPSPDLVKWTLRNLAAQGILKVLSGILVGKPQDEVYYEEYKAAILQVVAREEKLTGLPIVYNMNFGHAVPIGVIPAGAMAEIDCGERSVTILESATAPGD